jgi:phenylacetate-CoA ligase
MPGTARTMRRMARVAGRSDDMLIIRGVNVFPSQIEEILLANGKLSPHYVLEVRREGHLDELEVIVERRADMPAGLKTLVEREVEHHIKGLIGVSAKVAVAEPGAVPRSQGKAVRVIDKRPKG